MPERPALSRPVYFRKEGRNYIKLSEFDFHGWPANGLWLVSSTPHGGGQSLICSPAEAESLPALAFQYLALADALTTFLANSKKSLSIEEIGKLACDFFDQAQASPSKGSFRPRLESDFPIYTHHKGRYRRIGTHFRGFPSEGLWMIEDGRQNILWKVAPVPEWKPGRRHAAFQPALTQALKEWVSNVQRASLLEVGRQCCLTLAKLALLDPDPTDILLSKPNCAEPKNKADK